MMTYVHFHIGNVDETLLSTDKPVTSLRITSSELAYSGLRSVGAALDMLYGQHYIIKDDDVFIYSCYDEGNLITREEYHVENSYPVLMAWSEVVTTDFKLDHQVLSNVVSAFLKG